MPLASVRSPKRSGPRSTSLVDPAFAEGLAAFARAVAERYPWVEDFTPVNEPLTTARFSGLYGHWYPHGRDDLTFARDPQARLEFFARRHSSWDERYNLYPVLRVDTVP